MKKTGGVLLAALIILSGIKICAAEPDSLIDDEQEVIIDLGSLYDDTFSQEDIEEPYYDVLSSMETTYLGIILDDPGVNEVTDQLVQSEMKYRLQSYDHTQEVPGKAAETGDIVRAGFEYYIDGEIADTLDGVVFMIGDGTFPEEVEESFLGKTAGAVCESDVLVSEGMLHVKAVLDSVREYYPINDDTIAVLTDERYQNVSTFRDAVYQELLEEAENERIARIKEEVIPVLYALSNIKTVPEEALQYHLDKMIRIYKAVYGEEKYQENKEEVDKNFSRTAYSNLVTEMLVNYVAEKEGITVSDEDYREEAAKIREQNHIETADEWNGYLEIYGKETVMQYAKLRKVVDFVVENAEF